MNLTIKLLLALACLLFVGTANAEGSIVFLPFQGVKSSSLPKQVERILEEEGYSRSDTEVDLSPGDDQASFLTEATRHNIRAYILGYTEVSRKGWVSVVTVRSGHNGAVVGRLETISAWYPGLKKKLDATLGIRLAKALDASSAPNADESGSGGNSSGVTVTDDSDSERADNDSLAEDEPSTTEEGSESSSEDEPDEPFVGDGTPAFELEVGFHARARQWRVQNIAPGSGLLSNRHDATLVGPRVQATIYPVAFFSNNFLRHLGLEGWFFRSFGGETTAMDGPAPQQQVFSTISQDWYVGAKVRIPAGPLTLGLHGGIGAQELTVADTPTLSFLPDVAYSFARVGASADASFADFKVGLSAGFRAVNSAGQEFGEVENAEWFPNTSTSGFDVSLRVGYRLTPEWSIDVSGEFAQYSLTFNQTQVLQRPFTNAALNTFGLQAMPVFAEGATDASISGGLNVTYRFAP